MIIFSVGESATSNTKYLQCNNDRKKWLLTQNHIIIVSKRLDLEEFLRKPPKLTLHSLAILSTITFDNNFRWERIHSFLYTVMLEYKSLLS